MDLCNREMEVQQTINRPHKETESGYSYQLDHKEKPIQNQSETFDGKT